MHTNKAYIGFGANLPYAKHAPADTILGAKSALMAKGIRVLRFSRLWQSPAWPDPSEPAYVNAVAEVVTVLPPHRLLQTLRGIERQFGRRRSYRNAPRTLDLDLLSYENLCLRTLHLTLPHPGIERRAFVLLPLQEVAPQWRLPGRGTALAVMIKALTAQSRDMVLPLDGK
ncbi:MAG: 2-amino-4-hydroxy-6-hydroxymethyldihydropteridine diphosphokinase [Robiginitomaculum sp.]|nr:2-amino-4-hydroxy-6-hydroxymethyldihydropteridine diphosphokinase [Robiginitomaculum sp.]MDQ7078245.1 2-amino-4-hydroxy-6-hydroxymethyldihydropteridine diphosphokinase [Robiginitomaculum sp.]